VIDETRRQISRSNKRSLRKEPLQQRQARRGKRKVCNGGNGAEPKRRLKLASCLRRAKPFPRRSPVLAARRAVIASRPGRSPARRRSTRTSKRGLELRDPGDSVGGVPRRAQRRQRSCLRSSSRQELPIAQSRLEDAGRRSSIDHLIVYSVHIEAIYPKQDLTKYTPAKGWEGWDHVLSGLQVKSLEANSPRARSVPPPRSAPLPKRRGRGKIIFLANSSSRRHERVDASWSARAQSGLRPATLATRVRRDCDEREPTHRRGFRREIPKFIHAGMHYTTRLRSKRAAALPDAARSTLSRRAQRRVRSLGKLIVRDKQRNLRH